VRPPPAALQSVLADGIARFVAHKRVLGRRFRSEERELRLLDRFLHGQTIDRLEQITADLLEQFLASRPRRWPRSYNHLLGVVRRLFDWLVGQELLATSPVRATPRRATAHRVPYLFDAPLARRLLEVAGSLPDAAGAPLRGCTYRTIFALLYGLGLRVGEVARLQRNEVDCERAVLLVRATKFGKSRLVPFGPQMTALLREYLDRSGAHRGALPPEAPVFSFRRRRAIHPGTISQTFHHLLPHLALALPAGTAPPRVHDLRHAFAVGTLLRWYRAGINPSDRLLQLSTFLGHVNPTSTAVYLTITADLLQEAHQRFERWAAPTLPAARP
jgi:site-specific recombinase XerD